MKVKAKSNAFWFISHEGRKVGLIGFKSPFWWAWLCTLFHVPACQGRALLMMDVRGLSSADRLSRDDRSEPAGRSIKVHSPESNSQPALHRVRYSADEEPAHVCPSHIEGWACIQSGRSAYCTSAWNFSFWWTSAGCCHWLPVSVRVCVTKKQRRNYSHYRWIAKRTLACQLCSVTQTC